MTNNSESIMEVKGYNGQIILYKNKVKIKRKGFFAKLDHGFNKSEKTIHLDDILLIQLKKPESMINTGYIRFIVSTRKQSKLDFSKVQRDENTVLIKQSRKGNNYDKFKKLKQLIYNRLNREETVESYQLRIKNTLDQSLTLDKQEEINDQSKLERETTLDIECPNCGINAIIKRKPKIKVMLIISFSLGIIGFLLSFIIIGIPILIAGLLFLITLPFVSHNYVHECQNCDYISSVNKNNYK